MKRGKAFEQELTKITPTCVASGRSKAGDFVKFVNTNNHGQMNRSERSLRLLLAVLPWGFYALLLTPGPWQSFLFAPARFKQWVGLPCPLCGGTRATVALIGGDWVHSLYLNPLALLVLVGSVMWTAGCLWEALRGRELLPGWDRLVARAGRWLLAAILVFWVYHAASAWLLPKEELLNRQGILFRH